MGIPAGVRKAPSVAPAGHWTLAWRRLRRDRVGFACLAGVLALILLVFAGAPIAARLLHHGPNDMFPYAVDINDKPAGPWTTVPALHDLPPSDEYALEKPKPPKGTPNTLLILGGDGPLGHDEFLRLLYGGADSLEVQTHAWFEALVPGGGTRGEPVWVGVDPTNRRLAGETHVKIGHGRRYADVPPIKGVYRGAAGAHLDAGVKMTRLDPAASATP